VGILYLRYSETGEIQADSPGERLAHSNSKHNDHAGCFALFSSSVSTTNKSVNSSSISQGFCFLALLFAGRSSSSMGFTSLAPGFEMSL